MRFGALHQWRSGNCALGSLQEAFCPLLSLLQAQARSSDDDQHAPCGREHDAFTDLLAPVACPLSLFSPHNLIVLSLYEYNCRTDES